MSNSAVSSCHTECSSIFPPITVLIIHTDSSLTLQRHSSLCYFSFFSLVSPFSPLKGAEFFVSLEDAGVEGRSRDFSFLVV